MSEIETLKSQIDGLKQSIKDKRKKNADTTLLQSTSEVDQSRRITLRCRRVLKGHLAKVLGMDWCQKDQLIVSASQDGNLIIWDPRTEMKLVRIALKSSWVVTVAFSPDGNFVASGGLDNICTIYSVDTAESKHRIKRELQGHEGYISSCVFLDENRIATASGEGRSILWDTNENKILQTFYGHSADVTKICLKPADVNILATSSCDSTVRIWDTRIKNPCVQIFDSHESDVNSIAFHPCGTALASVSDDGTAKILDLTADNEIESIKFEDNGVPIKCTTCSFSKSGRLLFVGEDNNSVSITDILKGETVGKLTDQHTNKISCLQVSPEGDALCTASWDNLLKIFA